MDVEDPGHKISIDVDEVHRVFEDVRFHSISLIDPENALPGLRVTHVDGEPTTPGFYQYSGGNQLMIFLLDESGTQWYTFFSNGDGGPCSWGYIEQGLGVYDLLPITSKYEGRAEDAQKEDDGD